MADNSIKKISIVPFGPQHPVLPEPIHLDLVLQDALPNEKDALNAKISEVQ